MGIQHTHVCTRERKVSSRGMVITPIAENGITLLMNPKILMGKIVGELLKSEGRIGARPSALVRG